MTMRHVLTISSISGILGIMMGVLIASWAWLSSTATFASAGAMARAERGITQKVELLGHLRQARYGDAKRQLETWLDADVAHAAELAHDGAELSAATLRAVEAERLARATEHHESPGASTGGAGSGAHAEPIVDQVR